MDKTTIGARGRPTPTELSGLVTELRSPLTSVRSPLTSVRRPPTEVQCREVKLLSASQSLFITALVQDDVHHAYGIGDGHLAFAVGVTGDAVKG